MTASPLRHQVRCGKNKNGNVLFHCSSKIEGPLSPFPFRPTFSLSSFSIFFFSIPTPLFVFYTFIALSHKNSHKHCRTYNGSLLFVLSTKPQSHTHESTGFSLSSPPSKPLFSSSPLRFEIPFPIEPTMLDCLSRQSRLLVLELSNSSMVSLHFSYPKPPKLPKDKALKLQISSTGSSFPSSFPNLCNPEMSDAKLEFLSFYEKTKSRSINPFNSSNSRSDKLFVSPIFLLPLLVTFFLDDTSKSAGIISSGSVTSFPERMAWSFDVKRTESGDREPSSKLVMETCPYKNKHT